MYQRIRVEYHIMEHGHAPSDEPIYVDWVYPEGFGDIGARMPDGVASGAFHKRHALNKLFTDMGWHLADDDGHMLVWEA